MKPVLICPKIKFTEIQGFPGQKRYPMTGPDITQSNMEKWFDPRFYKDKLINSFYAAYPRPDEEVVIPGGWNTYRSHFTLEVQEQAMGSSLVHYLMGYTLPTDSVVLDRSKVALYLNRCVSYVIVTTMTGEGPQKHMKLVSDVSISVPQPNDQESHMLRPVDIFTTIEPLFTDGKPCGEVTIMDLRSMSVRGNNPSVDTADMDVSNWASKIIDSYWAALDVPFNEFGPEQHNEQVWRDAVSNARPKPIAQHPLLSLIFQQTDITQEGFVTLDQVQKLFDYTIDVTFNFPMLQDLWPSSPTHASVEALVARRIIDSMSASMAKYGVKTLEILTVRGETHDLGSEMFPLLSGAESDDCLEEVAKNVRDIVRAVVGHYDVHISVRMDLESKAIINVCLELDSAGHAPAFATYISNYPMFASGRLSSLMGGDRTKLVLLAQDMKILMEQLNPNNYDPVRYNPDFITLTFKESV